MRKYLLTIDYLDLSKTKVKSIITRLAQTQMVNSAAYEVQLTMVRALEKGGT